MYEATVIKRSVNETSAIVPSSLPAVLKKVPKPLAKWSCYKERRITIINYSN